MNHELVAKYGKPERLPIREDGCPAWAHMSEAAARAFAEANGEFGHVEFEDGRWLSVVDVPAMAAQISARLGYTTA